MANPDPEITPEDARKARDDVDHRHRTLRLSQPGQQRSRLPLHLPRRARRARQDDQHGDEDRRRRRRWPNWRARTCPTRSPSPIAARGRASAATTSFPAPFDPRLIHVVPIAVAKAAMESGVARRPIVDLDAYKAQLSARRDPIAGAMQRIIERVRRMPKRVVFAEGEEEQVIRAAYAFVNQRLGRGGAGRPRGSGSRRRRGLGARSRRQGHRDPQRPRCRIATRSTRSSSTSACSASGFLLRDCQRLINQDRNSFAAAMVAQGDADAMVTGVTRNFSIALEEIRRVIDHKPGHRVIGVSLILARGRPISVADTAITEMPSAEDLADIAIEAAGVARRLGYEPRVAMLAFSNFGHPVGERTQRVQEAVRILDSRRVDFEYDGEMGADVALNKELMAAYPFCRLTGTANVLVMPAFHSAAISTRMVQELGGATVIGPLIVGLEKPVQIVSLSAKDSDIVNMAALASFNIGG